VVKKVAIRLELAKPTMISVAHNEVVGKKAAIHLESAKPTAITVAHSEVVG